MSLWQTEVLIKKPPFQLSLGSSFYLIGSCFSTHIKIFLEKKLFNVTPSPFGIEYNPICMAQGLNKILFEKPFALADIIHPDTGFTTWFHHRKINYQDQNELLSQLNNQLKESLQTLNQVDCLMITMGTAFCYYLKDTSFAVNNCHKMPPHLFTRKACTVEEIVAALAPCLRQLKSANKNIKFIFTLSPVKHLRDDPTENSYSKALCRCSIEVLMELFKENSYYFPAFELMTDELRDYRFYDSSLTHPSPDAIQFIATKFIDNLIDSHGQEFLKEWNPIIKFLNHKIENTPLKSYLDANQAQKNKILALQKKYPMVFWPSFLKYF